MRKNTFFKSLCCLFAAFAMIISSAQYTFADEKYEINVTVDTYLDRKAISKYIYGINDTASLSGLKTTALNQAGNDFMTYNWENNFSNAGESYLASNRDYISDRYSRLSFDPAVAADGLMTMAKQNGIEFTIAELPMLGYVSADSNGPLLNSEAAPSDRWVKTYNHKGSEFSLTPDKTDDAVYIDEYLNYIINYYGKAAFGGVSAYSMGGDAFIWAKEFPLAAGNFTVEDYIEKNISLAETIKKSDSNALVIGGGFGSPESCVSFPENSGWNKYKNEYSWFIDFYLDSINRESKAKGARLIDVLDVKYFPDEKTSYGMNIISDNSDEANKLRIQSVRALWDGSYTNDGEYKEFYPLLPTLQASINEYYPGTKLSLTEYNFGGGGNISGGIAQVEALGCFAEEGVFLACLSPERNADTVYQYSAINLFTNFDGNGGNFGNVSVRSDNSNNELCSSFAAIDNEGTLNIILANKSDSLTETINVKISSEYKYTSAKTFGFSDGRPEITEGESFAVSGDEITVELEPYSVVLVSLSPMLSFSESTGDTTTVTSIATEEPLPTTTVSETSVTGENDVTSLNDDNDGDRKPLTALSLLKGGALFFAALTVMGMLYLFINELKSEKKE
ncbi:MAG: glycoside hydrolase family 44 protein [Oscillospiraceae bacterium]